MWQLEMAATNASSGSTLAGSPLRCGAEDAGTSTPAVETPDVGPGVGGVGGERRLPVPLDLGDMGAHGRPSYGPSPDDPAAPRAPRREAP